MRRFRTAGSFSVGEQKHDVADTWSYLFPCTEATATDPLSMRQLNLSSASLYLSQLGAGVSNISGDAPWGAPVGSRKIGNGCGWFQAPAGLSAVDGDTASLGYSFGGWFSFVKGTVGTTPFLTYSNYNTSPNTMPFATAFSLVVNADGRLRYLYDSTASTSWDIPVGQLSLTAPNHIGVVTTSSIGGYRGVDVYVNGQRTYSAASLAEAASGVKAYDVGRFQVGANYHAGPAGTNTPYIGTGNAFVSDVFFRRGVVDGAFLRQCYGDGVCPWDEEALVKSGNYKVLFRVLIEDQDSAWVDLSNHYGRDWVKNASTSEAVDGKHKTASIRLRRWLGKHLALSPMDQDSVLNLNAGGSFEELIDNRRQVRIETATVPPNWTIQGWEWAIEFEGFIDKIEWAEDDMQIDCIDRIAPLSDMFQLEPREYPYFTSQQRAETHIQRLIDDNTPAAFVHTSGTVLFGYKGGAIQLYTPNSTGWAIRHDEAPAATVLDNCSRIAATNAWDLRWVHNDYDARCRFTYSDPNRTQQLSVATVLFVGVSSGTYLQFRTVVPHGLRPGQRVVYQDSQADFDGTWVIQQVLDSHVVQVADPAPAGVASSGGYLTIDPVYLFEPREILDVARAGKDIADVRNLVSLKYHRMVSAACFSAVYVHHTSAAPATIRALIPDRLSSLQVGDEFTIDGCTGAASVFNAVYSVGSIAYGTVTSPIPDMDTISGTWVYSAEPQSGSTSSAALVKFSSEYVKFKDVVQTSTPSIAKYGLRPCQISESSTTGITEGADAIRLAYRVLSDLKEPNTSLEITIKYLRHLQLHDWIGAEADPMRRWSGTFTGAVTSINHDFTPGACVTRLGIRYAAATLGAKFAQRLLVGPTRPGIPTRHIVPANIPGPGNRAPQASTAGGRSIRVSFPHGDDSSDERYRRTDKLEVHVSTAAEDFIPNVNTLAGRFTGGGGEITKLSDGSDITPGTQYFIKMRWVDVYGNPSTWTSASAMIPRAMPGEGCLAGITGTAATVTLTTSRATLLYAPFNIIDGSDVMGRTADTFARLTTSSAVTSPCLFTPPVTGRYRVDLSMSVCPSRTQSTKVAILAVNKNWYDLAGGNLATPYFLFTSASMGPASATSVLSVSGTLDVLTAGEQFAFYIYVYSSGFYLHQYSCASVFQLSQTHLQVSLEDPAAAPVYPVDTVGGLLPV